MNLKIKLFIVFVFMFCASGFSQDSAKTQKVIYKIPAEKVKPASHSEEKKISPLEDKSIHSSEVNKKKKEMIVTKKSSDGTLSKEKFEIIESK